MTTHRDPQSNGKNGEFSRRVFGRHVGTCTALFFGGRMLLASEPAHAEQAQQRYANGPFSLSAGMRGLAMSICRDNPLTRNRIQSLFRELQPSGAHPITIADAGNRVPRDASEAFAHGGDCSEIANLLVGMMNVMELGGQIGIEIFHLVGRPATEDHSVAYWQPGARNTRLYLDLQMPTTMANYPGESRIDLNGENAASALYAREFGDYFRENRQNADALAAYELAYTRSGSQWDYPRRWLLTLYAERFNEVMGELNPIMNDSTQRTQCRRLAEEGLGIADRLSTLGRPIPTQMRTQFQTILGHCSQ